MPISITKNGVVDALTFTTIFSIHVSIIVIIRESEFGIPNSALSLPCTIDLYSGVDTNASRTASLIFSVIAI